MKKVQTCQAINKPNVILKKTIEAMSTGAKALLRARATNLSIRLSIGPTPSRANFSSVSSKIKTERAQLGRWSAEVDVDLPVSIENTALQIVPDYRLRGGVSFHF